MILILQLESTEKDNNKMAFNTDIELLHIPRDWTQAKSRMSKSQLVGNLLLL